MMKNSIAMLVLCITCMAMPCSTAWAYTLNFDDIPSGSDLSYYTGQYGVEFSQGYGITDHQGVSWGSPHSTPNVLVFTVAPGQPNICRLDFADGISSLSAYYSTDDGAIINVTGYYDDLNFPVAQATVGAPFDTWDNQYVSLTAAPGYMIKFIVFEPVGSTSALLGFCADDMTVVPVPEPSSLLGLVAGSACLFMGKRRQRL